MARTIGLTSDLGESLGACAPGSDEAMMGEITSAGAACGLRAGDPPVMERTADLARERASARPRASRTLPASAAACTRRARRCGGRAPTLRRWGGG
jgi:hypothetical protein